MAIKIGNKIITYEDQDRNDITNEFIEENDPIYDDEDGWVTILSIKDD